MEFNSLEYFIKVINEHIWVIAGYPLMQFDVNGVQFRILTICKIIRSQFSEQVAAPRDWKHYVPIVYLIVNLHLLHNAHRNLDNQLGANNIITAPTLPLLWCYAQPRHGAGPRRAVIMWILWVESHKPAENVQLVASHLPRMSGDQAGVLTSFLIVLQHSGSAVNLASLCRTRITQVRLRNTVSISWSRWLVYL